METYLVKTSRLPWTVNFTINTGENSVPIYIVGFDPLNPNTLYFRSRFIITGEENINLGMPQSPIMLKILVWAEDGLPYELSSITLDPLDAPKSEDPNVIFIEKFSRIAGISHSNRTYTADNVPFVIEYLRNIYTDEGEVHPTPARAHTELPLIQISKAKFAQNTIPERIIILLHEKGHLIDNMNPDDEKEADQNALNIYNQLGYPKIEAINAFGDIMPDTDDNYQRMLNLVNM